VAIKIELDMPILGDAREGGTRKKGRGVGPGGGKKKVNGGPPDFGI